MTSHETRQSTTLWERGGRFFLDWIKSLGLYAAIVSAGTLLFMVGSSIVGYLAYSDRPGAGWGPGVFSWGEVKFFVGWLPLLIYSLGAVLLGAQMMSIGFLAELITAYSSRDQDSYSIAERVGHHEAAPDTDHQPSAKHE